MAKVAGYVFYCSYFLVIPLAFCTVLLCLCRIGYKDCVFFARLNKKC